MAGLAAWATCQGARRRLKGEFQSLSLPCACAHFLREKLLQGWLQDGPVRKRDLVKSEKAVRFSVRTRRAADTLGVVRSFEEQENTPRRYWPIVWSLPDMSDED